MSNNKYCLTAADRVAGKKTLQELKTLFADCGEPSYRAKARARGRRQWFNSLGRAAR